MTQAFGHAKSCEHNASSEKKGGSWKDGSLTELVRALVGYGRRMEFKPSSHYNCFSSKVTITHETERVASIGRREGGFLFVVVVFFFFLCLYQSAAARLLFAFLRQVLFFLFPLAQRAGGDFIKTSEPNRFSCSAMGWIGVLSLTFFFHCSYLYYSDCCCNSRLSCKGYSFVDKPQYHSNDRR
jgi:hypothetical protein